MTESKDTQESKEQKADKKPAHPAQKKQSKKSSPWLAPLFILLLVVIGGGYSAWYQYQQQQSRNSKDIEKLTAQVDKLTRAQKYQSEDQQKQLDALTEQHNDLKRSFAALLKSSGHLKNDWLLAEAEYLVKLANYRLIFEKDITTAIAAMEAADERLREVADPALIEVRKVLLEQTQALRAIKQPDLAGMALQISALKKQVPQLAMKTPDPATVAKRARQPSEASRVKSWDELPKAMWEDLKGLIKIRDHSQAVQPLIPPEQFYFLQQNLYLQLEQARLALLKGNNNLYSDSIYTAIQWIETYFDKEQQTTQSLLEGLRALTKNKIDPEIPDISQSYKVIQQYRVNGFVPKKKKPDQENKNQVNEKAGEATSKPAEPQNKKPESSTPVTKPVETPEKVKL
ncbi:MAG: uroporphyrinogen-III C-methyltransferase [Gammaproteobacteria bacterium]